MDLAMRRVAMDGVAAFAVLSIYLLTLLVPLHQAQATQDNFNTLGFDSLSGWSLCIAGDAEPEQTERLPHGCPFAGISKISLTPPAVPDAGFGRVAGTTTISYCYQASWPAGRLAANSHPARAPPVLP